MTTFDELRARQRELTAQIAARADGTPNLRDYGLDRRADFERDLTAYHAATQELVSERDQVHLERMAARR